MDKKELLKQSARGVQNPPVDNILDESIAGWPDEVKKAIKNLYKIGVDGVLKVARKYYDQTALDKVGMTRKDLENSIRYFCERLATEDLPKNEGVKIELEKGQNPIDEYKRVEKEKYHRERKFRNHIQDLINEYGVDYTKQELKKAFAENKDGVGAYAYEIAKDVFKDGINLFEEDNADRSETKGD